MNGLTTDDLRRLADSFIPPQLAEAAALRRVTDEEGATIVDRRRRAGDSYAGIVFPYTTPAECFVREYRLRRDKPDLELQADGTKKEKAKYLSPPGRGNMLYFPPNYQVKWLRDASRPIVITEGEKKCLALSRLASNDFAREQWHFLPVGLGGVWNWRGIIGKTTTENGGKANLKGLITDFSFLDLKGRQISILFDSNVDSNSNVKAARSALAKELRERGANIYFVDLLEIEGVNGVDDLLGLWEREEGIEGAISNGLNLLDSKYEYPATKEKKRSQATLLMDLIDNLDVDFFHTPDRKLFASIPVQSHFENHEIRSRFFREWLSYQLWQAENKMPSTQALEDTLRTLSGRAQFDSPEADCFVRIAEYCGDRIYLDLASDTWEVVEITKRGWTIIAGHIAPVKFRRSKGLQALPRPEKGGDPRQLFQHINVAEESFPLVCAWLVNSFRPGKPIPLLILNGEQGSAKSTTSRVLKRIIDPSQSELRSQPRNEQDLMISANNSWLVAFDNLSKIPDWLSDSLCRLSTGGGFSTRTLYENDEETIFEARRPILLNGITELATKPDLLDRSLLITCPNIPKHERRDEEEFWREFEREHPRLLGAFLTALSETLSNLPNVSLTEKERMADFQKLGVASEAPLGFAEGTFLRAYSDSRREAHGVAMDSSVTAVIVIAFIGEHEKWEGTATLLLKELRQFAEQHSSLGVRPDDLPKKSNMLSAELTRIAPNLRESGVGFHKIKSGNRKIVLEKLVDRSSASSASSEGTQDLPSAPDDSGTILIELGDVKVAEPVGQTY